jgi:hypothetical protein
LSSTPPSAFAENKTTCSRGQGRSHYSPILHATATTGDDTDVIAFEQLQRLSLSSPNTLLLRESFEHSIWGPIGISSQPTRAKLLAREDLDVEPTLPAVANLRSAVAANEGVIIATPEYNSGLPGVLKNALD